MSTRRALTTASTTAKRRGLQLGTCLLDRPGVGVGDLLDDLAERVTRADVAADRALAVGVRGLRRGG
jgi:hypothetical protein